MPRPLPTLSSNWEHFLTCIVLHLALPLMPLLLMGIFGGSLEVRPVTLSAAMYSIGLGLSSRRIGILALGIVQGMSFSAIFGFLSAPLASSLDLRWPLAAMALIAFFHLCERFNRHVVEREPYPKFVDEGRRRCR